MTRPLPAPDPDRPPATRGRPRDPGKRDALLDAAHHLFVDRGLEAVTMDQIVLASGVSRATLYDTFADKSALIEAMVARASERIVGDDWAQSNLEAGPAAALTEFGVKLLTFLADPQTRRLERLIASATRPSPDLGARCFAAGPGRAQAMLRALIVAAQTQGSLRPADPGAAVADLLGLWQGFMRVELAFGQSAAPTPAAVHARAAHGVRQFLRLYGADTNAIY